MGKVTLISRIYKCNDASFLRSGSQSKLVVCTKFLFTVEIIGSYRASERSSYVPTNVEDLVNAFRRCLTEWAAWWLPSCATEGWRSGWWAGWISPPHRSRSRCPSRLRCRASGWPRSCRTLLTLLRSCWSHLPTPILCPPLCQKWSPCVITHPTVSISHRLLMRWGNTDREQPTARYRSTVRISRLQDDFSSFKRNFREYTSN